MHTDNTFDFDLATKVLAVLTKQTPEDQRLEELSKLIQLHIEEKGRGTKKEPSMAAVLEESLTLDGLTTQQKLKRSRQIVEFMQYMGDLLEEIPAKKPDLVRDAEAKVPEFAKFLAPLRKNLN